MNKKILLLLLAICCFSGYSQKKKPVAKAPAAKKTVLAKSENITLELSEKKDSYRFYMLNGKDSVMIKFIQGRIGTNVPMDGKITPFTTKGTKLYSVTWTEKSTIGDAKTKLENITETHTEIWNIATKTKLFENVQKVNNITEIVWLDPNKTASKTQEKIKRDGFELALTPEGDIMLKNKTQQDKMTYDAGLKKFISKK
jgi:hypothetical protein